MLLVRAWVGPSKIHGLGLIAYEFIPKDTVIWRLVPGFDAILTKVEFQALSHAAQEQINHYAFFYTQRNAYVLCADDARFTNHSDNANSRFCGDYDVAVRDIQAGEEITDNYTEYEKQMLQITRPPMELV